MGRNKEKEGIVISSGELYSVLQSLSPGLASKEILEQSKCFIFTGGWVCTYNDRIMVNRPLPFDFDEDGAVNAVEILRLLGNMPEQQLTLNFTKSALRMKGKKSQTKIPLHSEILLPVNDIELPEEFEDIPDNFMEALAFCLFSCAKDMSYPVLTCLKIEGDEVVSSDNSRGTSMTLSEEIPYDEPILLPYYVVQELIKYEVLGMSASEDWIHFSCADDVVFSCRTIEGAYPETDDLFEGEGMREFTLPEQGLLESIERVQIFSKADITLDEHVLLHLTGNTLYLTGRSERGEHKERLKLEEEPEEEIHFSIHPVFLKQILERGDYSLKEDGDKILVEGTDFVHVALLYVEEGEEG